MALHAHLARLLPAEGDARPLDGHNHGSDTEILHDLDL
jgi:hypothetical protein